jgi:hypothetical protein
MAQCREIQRLPLNFTNFMDGRELREAVLREQSGSGIPYEVEVWYDGEASSTSGAAGRDLQKTTTYIRASSWLSTFTLERRSLT